MRGAGFAELFLGILALYGAAGLVTAICFALFGVRRALALDGRVTWGARILLVPAAAALWPLVLRRWRRTARR
jgi:hypothetical protein